MVTQGALRGGPISNESAFYSASILSRRGKEKLAAQILKPVLALDFKEPQGASPRVFRKNRRLAPFRSLYYPNTKLRRNTRLCQKTRKTVAKLVKSFRFLRERKS